MFKWIISSVKLLFCKEKEFYRFLNQILGFAPGRIQPYKKAFIHKSASYQTSEGKLINNERLEFLGDAILSAVIADYLFHKYPKENEGFLTKFRSKIVNGNKLSEIARKMKLQRFIVSNTNGSNNVKNIYGDALEALIGAIYLDKGYHVVSKFICQRVLSEYLDLPALKNAETNFKSRLIEWGQKYKHEIEFFTELESEDSDIFVSYVKIDNATYGSGSGKSKKAAEQLAAKKTLEEVNI